MKYIEIQEGITLNVDCIEGIEKINDTQCKIHTHHHSYLTIFPYSTLVEILKQKTETSTNVLTDRFINLDKILSKNQFWAG